VSSNREQLKDIVRDLISEKMGDVGFKLGQQGQKNEFMTFFELYGQEPAQWLFFRVPKSLTTFGGAVTAIYLAGGKDAAEKLAQYYGVGSGDLATDFSKILVDINKKGSAGFKDVFPGVTEHFAEVAGKEAESLSKGDISALKKSLVSDLGSAGSKLVDISRSPNLQEMITKYGSFIGVNVDMNEISDFLAKHSAEMTGDLAALEDTLRRKEIPEWIDGMFGEWRQGFSDLTKDFPGEKDKMMEIFDSAREKLSL